MLEYKIQFSMTRMRISDRRDLFRDSIEKHEHEQNANMFVHKADNERYNL